MEQESPKGDHFNICPVGLPRMKNGFVSRLLSAVMVVLLVLPLAAWPGKKQQPKIQQPATLQQKVAHLVKFSDGLCTATAIGPHALLTAEHCVLDEDGQPTKDHRVRIDLSRQFFHILAVASDGRDHVIMLLDGPAFVNFVNLVGNVRSTVSGETVYMYGDGGGEYPPRRLDGVNVPGWDANSDVDQAQHIQRYTMKAIPGDSGSAIYGLDGKVVALVTYKTPNDMTDCFELDFLAGAYRTALTFNGDLSSIGTNPQQ